MSAPTAGEVTKLQELMAKAAPLPWQLRESLKGCNGHTILITGSKPHPNGHDIENVRVLHNFIGGYIPGAIADYQAHFAIITHAVNILPKMVAALQDAVDTLAGFPHKNSADLNTLHSWESVLAEANNPEEQT